MVIKTEIFLPLVCVISNRGAALKVMGGGGEGGTSDSKWGGERVGRGRTENTFFSVTRALKFGVFQRVRFLVE